jgi:hypothetical protein
MHVEFCLAQQDPDGNPSNGIVRKDARSIPDYEEFGIGYLGEPGADETRLKRFSNWPHAFVYNIWVVHEIAGDWGGFAYFPFDQQYTADGVVIKSNTITYSSSTLAHERLDMEWAYSTLSRMRFTDVHPIPIAPCKAIGFAIPLPTGRKIAALHPVLLRRIHWCFPLKILWLIAEAGIFSLKVKKSGPGLE